MLVRVNQKDLERLGINPDKWAEHQARIDAEQPFEVRVVGGIDVLRTALKAAGAEFSITNHTPELWGGYVPLSQHGCPHEKQCPPDLSVPDVLMFCNNCKRSLDWHECHYCCPTCGINRDRIAEGRR